MEEKTKSRHEVIKDTNRFVIVRDNYLHGVEDKVNEEVSRHKDKLKITRVNDPEDRYEGSAYFIGLDYARKHAKLFKKMLTDCGGTLSITNDRAAIAVDSPAEICEHHLYPAFEKFKQVPYLGRVVDLCLSLLPSLDEFDESVQSLFPRTAAGRGHYDGRVAPIYRTLEEHPERLFEEFTDKNIKRVVEITSTLSSIRTLITNTSSRSRQPSGLGKEIIRDYYENQLGVNFTKIYDSVSATRRINKTVGEYLEILSHIFNIFGNNVRRFQEMLANSGYTILGDDETKAQRCPTCYPQILKERPIVATEVLERARDTLSSMLYRIPKYRDI